MFGKHHRQYKKRCRDTGQYQLRSHNHYQTHNPRKKSRYRKEYK
jgi:hypothetical protein